MILGVGVDVVHVQRINKWLSIPGLCERFFHPEELETALSKGSAAALSLAARFAAKEALGKAFGTGLRGIKLTDICVYNSHNGKPSIKLSGNARKLFDDLYCKVIHLSLTHERDNAIAMVVLEAQGD